FFGTVGPTPVRGVTAFLACFFSGFDLTWPSSRWIRSTTVANSVPTRRTAAPTAKGSQRTAPLTADRRTGGATDHVSDSSSEVSEDGSVRPLADSSGAAGGTSS